MSFDQCKEDRQESYPCECGGNITYNKETHCWECDSCDFIRNNPDDMKEK